MINDILKSGMALAATCGIAGLGAHQGTRFLIHVTNKLKTNAISPETANTAKKMAFAAGATATFTVGAPIAILCGSKTGRDAVKGVLGLGLVLSELGLRVLIAPTRHCLGLDPFPQKLFFA